MLLLLENSSLLSNNSETKALGAMDVLDIEISRLWEINHLHPYVSSLRRLRSRFDRTVCLTPA